MHHINSFAERSHAIVSSVLAKKYTGVALGSLVLAAVALKVYAKVSRYLKRKSYPKDVVILHQFPRGKKVPR
jgi:hypothetical protein